MFSLMPCLNSITQQFCPNMADCGCAILHNPINT